MPSRWRMPSEYWRTRLRARRAVEPDELEQLVDARLGRRRSSAAETAQRLAAAAAGVLGGGVEQHADARGRGWAARGSGLPSTVARPASGGVRPQIIRIVVDLPAPLGPRKPVTVPGSQRNDTSSDRRCARRSACVRSVDFDHGRQHGGSRRPARPRPRGRRRVDFGRWSRSTDVVVAGACDDDLADHMLPEGLLVPGSCATARTAALARDWIVDVAFVPDRAGDRRARVRRHRGRALPSLG